MSDEKTRAYFDLSTADRSRKGVFTRIDDVKGFQVQPGLVLKPVTGEKLMLSFGYMEPHTVAPEHCHPEEQMGTIIDGEYEFILNGERRLCRRGDVYYVPPNVPHSAVTYDKPCLFLDIFTPPRKAFQALAEMEGSAKEGENG